MLVELLTRHRAGGLYWWEIGAGGLLPPGLPPGAGGSYCRSCTWNSPRMVLIALMLAASMIDVDEKIIPDEITIPGTLVGLLLAAAWPVVAAAGRRLIGGQLDLDFLQLTSPNAWPAWLDGRPQHRLALAWGWPVGGCGAWRCCRGRGTRGTAGCGRCSSAGPEWSANRSTYRILRMAVMGSLAIALVWFRGGTDWQGLLSALVGMAAGGGLVWLVRIIGTAALRREAMGFGDVTLMAMIGAFLGWQPCLLIFFLAPVAGLVVGVLRLILFRDRRNPLRPVPLPGRAVCDRLLGRDLGRSQRYLRPGLARAAGDARLPGADGRDAGGVAADSRPVSAQNVFGKPHLMVPSPSGRGLG